MLLRFSFIHTHHHCIQLQMYFVCCSLVTADRRATCATIARLRTSQLSRSGLHCIQPWRSFFSHSVSPSPSLCNSLVCLIQCAGVLCYLHTHTHYVSLFSSIFFPLPCPVSVCTLRLMRQATRDVMSFIFRCMKEKE